MTEFFQTTAAIVAALGIFLGAIVSLIQLLRDIRNRSKPDIEDSEKAVANSVSSIRDDARGLLKSPETENELRQSVDTVSVVLRQEIHDRMDRALPPCTDQDVEQVLADVLPHVNNYVSEHLHNLLMSSQKQPLQATLREVLLNDVNITNAIDVAIRKCIARASVLSIRIWKGATVVLSVLSVCFLVGFIVTYDPKGVDAAAYKCNIWTQEAWKHFEEGEKAMLKGEQDEKAFENAIRVAEMCIDEFAYRAGVDQQNLIDKGVPRPTERYENEDELQKVLDRGVLNDVGTCYYIVGRSWEYLAEADEVRDLEKVKQIKAAYESAIELGHAATWDPDGKFFWFPGKKVKPRLKRIEEQASKK